jgi:hypothetical protein
MRSTRQGYPKRTRKVIDTHIIDTHIIGCHYDYGRHIVFVRLPTSLFYIERDPHSRTEIGERDTLVVHKNEATVAWPEAIARHKPRRQSGVIKAHHPSHSTFPWTEISDFQEKRLKSMTASF